MKGRLSKSKAVDLIMKNSIKLDNWKLALVPHGEVRDGFFAKSIKNAVSR
jgi:hypothetical protein